MRILVATSRTNGTEVGDYHHGIDGELVYMQEPCGKDVRDPDGPCGCGRGFAGMSSHRASSTALVIESSLTGHDLREALAASLEAGGWIACSSALDSDEEAWIDDLIRLIRQVAEHFPVGTVVRRRLTQYAPRFA